MKSAPSPAIPQAVTTRVILYAGAPYLDLELTLHGKPADPWPEAGWIVLPFKLESPCFRLGRLDSIVDPAADVVAGSNRNLFAVNTGAALFGADRRGVGLCAPDNPLLSLDTPGAWKYEPDFVPRKPVVYVQLFNNQWTTNFRFWNEGTWTARVRLWAFDRYDGAETLVRPSLETRYPLRTAVAEGPGGRLPTVQKGLEISSPGTLVTAFGPNPDGGGTILRLWELAGRSGSCTVRLPAGMRPSMVQPVDLRGRAAGLPIAVREGAFIFTRRSFAPASFLIAEGHPTGR
jgi:alpha-mannosidase